MIADVQSLFSNDQAVTVSAPSANYYDRGALGTPVRSNAQRNDLGRGTKIPFLVQVTRSFVGATSVQVSVQVDDNSAFASPRTIAQTPAIPVEDLRAGYQFGMDTFPRGANERFVRLFYTVAGGPAGAGAIFAGLVLEMDDSDYYVA